SQWSKRRASMKVLQTSCSTWSSPQVALPSQPTDWYGIQRTKGMESDGMPLPGSL
ncbi:hypothetical protein PV325_013061, partial [Microctonus aethiopoides]